MSSPSGPSSADPIRDHRRQWRRCRYVYPVVSRRSRGLSLGVNLNPDKQCTFSCVYCQVDRRLPGRRHEVDFAVLRAELEELVGQARRGRLWREPRLAATPPALRRLNDIAFSGDGEPTCVEHFDRAVELAASVRRKARLKDLKIVVISNASAFHLPPFQRALPILDANNGEVWAKLDAGSEELFARINRPYPVVTLRQVLDNILMVARGRPIVIQGLFFRLEGQAPTVEQVGAYCQRLDEILHGGGQIRRVQVYTIARSPATAAAAALSDRELDAVAEQIRQALPSVPVESFYGLPVPPQGRP